MPVRLHVNIDHVATVRQARGTSYPDPVFAAQLCEQSGADGITLHLREDRRHIGDRDVERMREVVRTLMNLECACTAQMISIAARVRPDCVTLVPERREERTTEGGLDVVHHRDLLEQATRKLRDARIKVSFFIAPDEAQVRASAELRADQVEFHTGPYAHAALGHEQDVELKRIRHAARVAHDLGLAIAAGHGLTRANVPALVRSVALIEELNIGHSIISDAVFMGLPRAVRAMRSAIRRGLAGQR